MATNRVRQLVRELPRNNYIMGKAMRAAGYSDSYSLNPHRVKRTKGYNRLMQKELERLQGLRDRAIAGLEGKDPSQEEYKTLVIALESYTKIINLLQDKPTEITMAVTRQMTDAEIDAEEERLNALLNGTETGPVASAPVGEVEAGESEA